MDEVTMLHIVALTIALTEGLKVAYDSLAGKPLNSGIKLVATVLVGAGLAAVAEFAPDAWVRVVPLLTVGLASAGLYSIGKRGGAAVVNGINGNK